MPLNAKLVQKSDFSEIERALGAQPLTAQSRLLAQIKDSCSNELKDSIIVTKENDIVGFTIFEKLLWDTAHFGINIGRINEVVSIGRYEEALAAKDAMLKFIEERCAEGEFFCVYCRVDINDLSSIHSLESAGFRMIDALATLRFDFRRNLTAEKLPVGKDCLPKRSAGMTVRTWKEEDLEELTKIASTCYEYDRFHSDPMFPKGKSDELHGKWIVNCCKGLAHEVVVATLENKPVGFITCKIDGSIGIIDMVGVSKDFQRRQIGTLLVDAALKWFKDRDTVKFVDVGTQSRNIPALRLYINAGFRPVSSKVTFHKWFATPNGWG